MIIFDKLSIVSAHILQITQNNISLSVLYRAGASNVYIYISVQSPIGFIGVLQTQITLIVRVDYALINIQIC